MFSISTRLESSGCKNAYYQVSSQERRCGSSSVVEVVQQFCTDTFDVRIKLGADEYEGVKLFYETQDLLDESLCGPRLTTTNAADTTTSQAVTGASVLPD